MRSLISLLIVASPLTPPARAVELAKIDRSIHKEPAYQGQPKYCLLAFGPEAKTRIWLALDGQTLHVDRNADGDLTGDGEKIAAKKGRPNFGDDAEILFDIGDIHDGPRTHKKLTLYVRKMDYLVARDDEVKAWLARTPQARGLSLFAEVDMPGWKGDGSDGRIEQQVSFRDARGFLTFADRPADAPIIHFGGPWQATLPGGKFRLTLGREQELFLEVGTPGLGAGTTARIAYEGVIPESVHPHIEIAYPPAKSDEPPRVQQVILKERC